MRRALLPILLATMVVACAPRPTGPSLLPTGAQAQASGRVVSGTVQGAKVSATTKVALVGFFANASTLRLDGDGQPQTSDVIVSVPVVDGRYGMDLPRAPFGPPDAPSAANRGTFWLMAYNDDNGNHQIDADEARVWLSDIPISYATFLGYSISRPGAVATDPTSFEKVNIRFD